ncbi:uncharacterized protein LOC122264893 [Penaeus japonicus]|uniref:uncharacterized protein LOC122264893 n=1 Tax=Penaeus japonicus TaxID=27405 RepID=UPI001C7100C2|nr:uncharacterized protein LOC122264893 [Penaeus japonicus]
MSAPNKQVTGRPMHGEENSPQEIEPDTNNQDEVADAKRRRSRAKGLLTKQMGIIDKLTTDSKNIIQVKEKMDAFSESIERFEVAHTELLGLLTDEQERLEAELYKSDAMGQVIDFQVALNNWIAQEEDGEGFKVHGDQEKRNDFAGPRTVTTDQGQLTHEGMCEMYLDENNNALEREIEELFKKQQLEMQNRQLTLQKERQAFELEKSKMESELMLRRESHQKMEEQKLLELQSYQTMERQLDTEGFGPTAHATTPMYTPGHPEANSRVPQFQSTPREPNEKPSRPSWEPSHIPLEDPERKAASILVDALNQVLDMSRVQQQSMVESLQVPRGELQTFSGDELEYWPFIRSFKDTIDCLSIPAAQKLACLRRYCKGRAALALKSTSYKKPEEGYKRALEILEERFGNPYNITCEWVRKVTSRSDVRGAADLREYSDELNCCLESLTEMNSLSQLGSGDNMLKIVEKLPYYLQTRWVKANHEIRSRYRRGAEIRELVRFISNAADEASDPVFGKLVNRDHKRDKEKSQQNRPQRRQPGSFATITSLTEDKAAIPESKKPMAGKCPCCGQGHYVIRCSRFKAMKIKDRWNLVMSKGLCVNCFAAGHIGKDCSRNFICTVEGCGKKHNNYLHLPSRRPDGGDTTLETPHVPVTVTSAMSQIPQNPNVNPRVSNFICSHGGKLALPIVPARVRCLDTSAIVDTYAMLDPGTNTTYCSEELCGMLRARGVTRHMELTTIAQTRMPVESTIITLLVTDLGDTQEPYCIPEVTVRPTLNIDLSGLSNRVEIQRWPHLKNLEIPELEVDQVHLLIGQDCADLLLPDEVRKGQPGEPFAIHTPLGWAINGPIDPFRPKVRSSHFVQNISHLESNLFKLWDLEGVNSEDSGMSRNDQKILETWDRKMTLENSHYTLNIPFKTETPYLPNNYNLAERRLRMLGKRLDKDVNLKKKYTGEIHKLLEKGYAEEVPLEEMNRADGKVWYLPHHPINNPKKPDKIRVVFDCAARFGGSSLNDHVCQGPDLANKLVGVLLRFREGAIAFMADIESMFHQVKVTPDDRDVLRFLWFQEDDTGGQSVTYRMTSHLFGGVWSPSCANYALQQVTREFKEEFPHDVLNTVLRNFYVDDCLKSVKTLEIAVPLANQVMQLLTKRGFHLTKFVSNSKELLNSINWVI